MVTRTIADQGRLVRWFVGPDATHWPDWTGATRGRFGRGVYTLRDEKVVREAVKRRKLKGEADVLVERLRAAALRALWDRLSLACRSGKLAIGQIAVRERLRDGRPALLFVAADAGASSRNRVAEHASRREIPILSVAEGARLGKCLGREFVSSALVEASAFADDLLRWSEGWSLWRPDVIDYQPLPSPKNPMAGVPDYE